MKISFIIPVYNCKTFLPDCISSIRSADISDYEILLIDDGSTDGSGALCDELAAADPEIRVVHQPNAGASAARNRGIMEAAGELLLFMDADDSIEPSLLSDVLSDLRCTEADLTIFGLTFDYYKNGNCYRRDPLFYAADEVLNSKTWGENFLALFENNSLSPVWNKVYRKDILQQYHLLFNKDMFLYEDLEFVLRYMQHCDRIWNVPQAIYHYRQSEDEGNAKRRLMRIDHLPPFLQPIEAALTDLLTANPTIGEAQVQNILQQLYLVLAREKISVSDLAGIRTICKDYANWSQGRVFSIESSPFYKNLREGKALRLLLAAKKTALRHKVAVWAKSHLYRI